MYEKVKPSLAFSVVVTFSLSVNFLSILLTKIAIYAIMEQMSFLWKGRIKQSQPKVKVNPNQNPFTC